MSTYNSDLKNLISQIKPKASQEEMQNIKTQIDALGIKLQADIKATR